MAMMKKGTTTAATMTMKDMADMADMAKWQPMPS